MAEGFKVHNSKGRPKGSKNRVTADIRKMIDESLDMAGGAKYLAEQANLNPQAYLSLIGKALPRDYNLGGQEDNPIVHRIEQVIVDPAEDDNNDAD